MLRRPDYQAIVNTKYFQNRRGRFNFRPARFQNWRAIFGAMRFLVASTFAKPEKAMTRRRMILMCAVTAVLGATALGVWRARDVPKVAPGFVAGVLCSGTFVSGLD